MTQAYQLTNLLLEPLSDDEYQYLSDYFDGLHERIESMNLSMIDGFFTALVLSPNSELPINWLETIIVDMDSFNKETERTEIVDMLFRHYQQLKYLLTLEGEPELAPIYLYHESSEQAWVADWCYGFVQGVQCDLDRWQELTPIFPILELITAVSTLPPPNEPLLEWQDDLSDDDKLFYETQQMAVHALEEYHKKVDPIATWEGFVELLVLSIHEYMQDPNPFSLEDDVSEDAEDMGDDVGVSPIDVNLICPCGSGKPFIACCGSVNRLIH